MNHKSQFTVAVVALAIAWEACLPAHASSSGYPFDVVPAQVPRQQVEAVAATIAGNTIIVDWHGTWDYATISEALTAASPGDTIIVLPSDGSPNGAYVESANVPAGVTLRSLVPEDPQIVASTIISGGVAAWHESVVNGFTIQNTATGIYVGGTGTAPLIRRCIIRDCVGTTNRPGGGMYVESSAHPTVEDCVFLNNSSPFAGGAVYFWYASATFVDCRFLGNTAVAYGGAVSGAPEGDGLNMEFHGCVFSGNQVDTSFGLGAAIACVDTDALIVNNCSFAHNRAAAGAVYIEDTDTVAIANSIFWGNIDNSGLTELAQLRATHPTDVAIDYSCIQGLDFFSSNGIANIDADPLFVDADGPDNIPGTADDDLSLRAGSPAIDAGDNTAFDAATTDSAGNPRFADDPCTLDIGVLDPAHPDRAIIDLGAYEYPELADDADNDTIPNCADNCPLHANTDQADCDTDGEGDVCQIAGGRATDCDANTVPDACEIAAGTASDAEGNGVIDICQSVIYVRINAAPGGDGTSWLTAYDNLQSGLAAANFGDEIWVAQGTYKPGSSRSSTFNVPAGVSLYGGFDGTETERDQRDTNSNPTILSGDVLNNDGPSFLYDLSRCLTSGGTTPPTFQCGGADLDGDSDVDADDLDLFLLANHYGENVYHVVTASGAAIRIDGFTITGGIADTDAESIFYLPTESDRWGGGILAIGADLVVADCDLVGNVAADHGGAIYCANGSLEIVGNAHLDGNAAGATGGAISAHHACSVSMTGGYIFSSGAGESGGAVFVGHASTAIFESMELSKNASANGGALYAVSNAQLNGCTLNFNTAGQFGGAIHAQGASVDVTASSFYLNAATEGAAIYNFASAGVLANTAFASNSAVFGGAIANLASAPNIVNCAFWNNAADFGAAVGNAAASPRIVNTTFHINNATQQGGALHAFFDSHPQIINSILWGDSAIDGAEIAIIDTNGSMVAAMFSDIEGGAPGAYVEPTNELVLGEGVIDADPLFDGSLHIGAASPAANTGTNYEPALLDVDKDGNARIQHCRVDMGAFETGGAPAIEDCNNNSIDDYCDVFYGDSADCNRNHIPDDCETDCNTNGVPDDCDIAGATSIDCNTNGIPDDCDAQSAADCQRNGIPDTCELAEPQVSAPAADNCADAPIIRTGLAYGADLETATNDGAASCGVSAYSSDVWLRYTPVADGVATATTITTNIYHDTVISVHTTCPGAEANELACNDDIDFANRQFNSTVTFDVIAGQTYFIRAAGYFGLENEFEVIVEGPDYVPTAVDCNTNAVPDTCDLLGGHDCCGSEHGAGCSNTAIEACVCNIDPYCCNTTWDRECVLVAEAGGCVDCVNSNDCNSNLVLDTCETLTPGDFNGDTLINSADLADFIACVIGPCGPEGCEPALYTDSCCRLADVDLDGDVDLRDFADFQMLFSFTP